jgi:hypothetical protein
MNAANATVATQSYPPVAVHSAPDAVTTTVLGACRMTGFGRTSINELIKSGELESVKVIGRRLITIKSIHAMIERRLPTKRAA